MPLYKWRYKAEPGQIEHLGPMAQDFFAAFELGTDRRHIPTVDADGVALAAIQGVDFETTLLKARVANLEKHNQQLESRLFLLEKDKSSFGSLSWPLWGVLGTVSLGGIYLRQSRRRS